MDFLILVCALSTSLILFAAGAEHAVGSAKLRSRMLAHGVFGARGVWWAGAGLPVAELLSALGAFWSVATSKPTGLVAALALQTVLFGSFAAYLAIVIRSGNTGVPCGCGPGEVPVGGGAVARAIALGVLSAVAASLAAFNPGPLTVRADVQGLLVCVASLTFAILLAVLVSARRTEPAASVHNVTIGSA